MGVLSYFFVYIYACDFFVPEKPFDMTIQSLVVFVVIVWKMLLAVAAFLVIAVPQIGELLKGENRTTKIIKSVIEAVISICVVVLFVVALSNLKRFYASRKLHL